MGFVDILPLTASMALVYSEACRQSLCLDGDDETSIDETMVSAIAIRVFHCDSLRTSPLGGGGRGASKGVMNVS